MKMTLYPRTEDPAERIRLAQELNFSAIQDLITHKGFEWENNKKRPFYVFKEDVNQTFLMNMVCSTLKKVATATEYDKLVVQRREGNVLTAEYNSDAPEGSRDAHVLCSVAFAAFVTGIASFEENRDAGCFSLVCKRSRARHLLYDGRFMQEKTTTDDPLLDAAVLGIEKGRLALFGQINSIFNGDEINGSSLDRRHIVQMCDVASASGQLLGFTAGSINSKGETMRSAQLQSPLTAFARGACAGSIDRCVGLTARMAMGLAPFIGSNVESSVDESALPSKRHKTGGVAPCFESNVEGSVERARKRDGECLLQTAKHKKTGVYVAPDSGPIL